MAPLVRQFPAQALPLEIQADVNGRKRKVEGGGNIELKNCELLVLTQYRCGIENPGIPECPVRCVAVDRCFRRCADKKGKFLVETTALEGPSAARTSSTGVEMGIGG